MKADARQAWLGEIDLCTNANQLEKIANALGVYVSNRKRPLAFTGNEEFIPPIRQRMRALIFDHIYGRRRLS